MFASTLAMLLTLLSTPIDAYRSKRDNRRYRAECQVCQAWFYGLTFFFTHVRTSWHMAIHGEPEEMADSTRRAATPEPTAAPETAITLERGGIDG